ncbi:MAG: aldehyde dehydrogenase family protein, partial [Paraburkholderia sp.]|nr:aldehyde dehydrogenase family protein [Paraburkholderia sp.]
MSEGDFFQKGKTSTVLAVSAREPEAASGFDELHGQVQATISEGARLVLGSEKTQSEGHFYASTVLADVTPDMTSFRQELFGPGASRIASRDAEHAVQLANDSEFGLGGTIWRVDSD